MVVQFDNESLIGGTTPNTSGRTSNPHPYAIRNRENQAAALAHVHNEHPISNPNTTYAARNKANQDAALARVYEKQKQDQEQAAQAAYMANVTKANAYDAMYADRIATGKQNQQNAIFNRAYSVLRPLETNNARIMELYLESTSLTSGEKDWRNFLPRILRDGISHILQQEDPNRQSMMQQLYMSSLDELKVPDEVCLAVTNFPDIEDQLSGRLNAPLGDLLNKLPGKVKMAIQAVNGITSLVSSFSKDGNSGGTSNQFAPYIITTPAYKTEQTEGFSFKAKLDFALGQFGLWNAKSEVVLPVLNLLAPAVLRFIDPVMQQGPFPTVWDLAGQVLKSLWTNMSGALTETEQTDRSAETLDKSEGSNILTRLATSLEDLVLSAYHGFMYHVKYGNFVEFTNALITSAKVSWGSNEVDQYGYPIAASIELGFKTLAPFSLTSSSHNNMAVRFGSSN